MTNQKKEELKKEALEMYENWHSDYDYITDWWLSQFDNIINEKIEKVEKVFDNHRLEDWSGEEEVYEEIGKLKTKAITILKE